MQIKRVTIQGFKTFARKTEFIFDPGVTAIVGPNGSGKSNVVDAIRWCLGEQSFSLLRSKKTSDVIFSGSDQKARLGMAQVTIVLDNSQGKLPVDFTEIEITRRAYRDGDNEYLLNNQRVRLQDITEILAQTGLGRRTYALIGQGLIDKILSLAPEELRSLFEEAAGITGYQAKRAMTIRRLDATQQNLTRVQDIVAELSPRLGYLKRQADRARERTQIATDLRTLLRDWYGYHWHSTLKNLETQHGRVAQLTQNVTHQQQQLAQLSLRIAKLRSQQTELRAGLSEWRRTSSQLHRQSETVTRELAVAHEKLRQLRSRSEELRTEQAGLIVQREAVAARLAETETTLSATTAEYERRQSQVEATNAVVLQRQQSRLQLQDKAQAARRTLTTLQTSQADQRGQIQQLAARQEQLADERFQLQQAEAQASEEFAQHSAKAAGLDQQTLQLQQQIEQAKHQLAGTEAEVAILQQKLADIQPHRQQVERELDRHQTRYDVLRRLQDEGAGYAGAVRAVLQASQGTAGRNSKLAGIVGTIASLLEVPPHLEKAIETALGGAYQNIVTATWEDTQAAISHLKSTSSGRATFLPLDRLNVLPAISAPQAPGILGNAAELVSYPPNIVDVVRQLLNRVWIAENLPAARRALDKITHGPRPTVVTLEGEIIRPGGAVTGGSDQTRRDDSILARERELRELPKAIEASTAQHQGIITQVTTYQQAIEHAQARLAPQRESLAHLQQQLQRHEEDRAGVRRLQDRAQEAAQWHTQRLVQIDNELARIQEEHSTTSARLLHLESQQQEAEALLNQAEAAVEGSGADEPLQQLADQRAAAAETHAHLTSQRDLIFSQRRSLREIDEQIAAKTQQLAQFEADAELLNQKNQELEQQERVLSHQINQLQAHIDPAEAKVATQEAAQQALEVDERALQEQLRKDESICNNAQLQHQRTDDLLRSLRHDIEQDLGLVLLDSGEDLAYQPPLPWDTIVEQLPPVAELAEGMEEEVREMRARLSRLNNVNPEAPKEYDEAVARHDYLLSQSSDLEAAIADMRKVIRELDEIMERELHQTFAAVSSAFVEFFQILFSGGTAKLILADPSDITNSGIEIIARPPGKRAQSLALLSGGERTLTALALVFAILRVSPTPFCVLDEVDAALDEANVDRFRHTIESLSADTQFILITHNRRTLEGTNAIYGVTMSTDGASRVISLRFDGEKIMRHAAEGQNSSSENSAASPGEDGLDELEQLVKL